MLLLRRSDTAQFNWLALWGLGAWDVYGLCEWSAVLCFTAVACCLLLRADLCLFCAGARCLLPFALVVHV